MSFSDPAASCLRRPPHPWRPYTQLPCYWRVFIQCNVRTDCLYLLLNTQAFCFLSLQELSDALGISIAGGKGSPLGDIPIFIAMIQASGVAARTQKLKVKLSPRRKLTVCVGFRRRLQPQRPCLKLELQKLSATHAEDRIHQQDLRPEIH